MINVKHSEVLKGTKTAISCEVTGLTEQLNLVWWEKPDGKIDDGDGYVIEEGAFSNDSNSQTTVLTILASANTEDAVYTCTIQVEEDSDYLYEKANSFVFSKYALDNIIKVTFPRYQLPVLVWMMTHKSFVTNCFA